jgi:magnesium-transporting ATPase (P-type)
LDKLICKHYQDLNGPEHECSDSVIADPANLYTPNDFKEGDETQKLLHYTLVFQVFVFLQLFNQINARKLGEELNVFSGVFNNCLFVGVVIFTFVIQMALVEVGGKFIKTHALSPDLNVVCILIGSFELVWGVIIKFMPLRYF